MSRKKVVKSPLAMVMIYSHKDRNFLRHSQLLDFLQGLTTAEGWEFWWDEKMDHPLFDDEIRKRLDDADVVICLISQPFLNSAYITTVEAKITFERLINEGILVVPVMLDACLWEDTEWLKALHHFPTEGYLQSSRKKSEVYLEITKYIRKWYHNRATAFRDPQMVYKLRRLPEAQLSKEQVKILIRDSCDRARKMVPDPKVRDRLEKAARASMKKNEVKVLSKAQLQSLDEQFLSHGSRKPDAELVRWVLRCKRLHPQGRVVSKSKRPSRA
ncbi:MAG TPA: toll/interleukin-1 receptor domain-containing protein [Pyrinomonadaceae bacterium]|nr:toll/interleukin-1 receptor domain-containing protein [Pyrinomonadaceae bacterium]